MPDGDPCKVAEWISAFIVQRKEIERGIRANLSVRERETRLVDADAALPEIELPDSDGLQRVADRLEEKLQEMVGVILSGGAPNLDVRLPSNFELGPGVETLREEIFRDERLWLFKGGIQEILYRFRDQGRALILEERDKLLGRLSASVLRMQEAVTQLNDHPVVAQALDASEMLDVEQTLSAARALVGRYEAILNSRETGVASLLENNYYQLQGQFIAACTQLCLQLYGNVSNAHLRELLDLKSVRLPPIIDPRGSCPAAEAEAQRKHLERKRDLVLRRVMTRAKKEKWPTWPILQLYKYDPRFGRARPREIHQTHNAGLESACTPTDRSGTPLAGGW